MHPRIIIIALRCHVGTLIILLLHTVILNNNTLGALDCFNLWLCTVVYSRKKMFAVTLNQLIVADIK